MKVKKLVEKAIIPTKEHDTDLGYDLYCLDDNVSFYPGKQYKFSTGIAVQFPIGYGGLVKDRSSMAVKGLHVLGGVIDGDYRGEIKIMLVNLSEHVYKVNYGDRIAQLVLIPIINCDVFEVDELDETVRGKKGFGSSGK